MDTPRAPSPAPVVRRSDFLLLAAVGFLWLFAAGVAVPRAWAAESYLQTALFVFGSVGFLAQTTGAFNRWYEPRGYRGYFFHQFVLLALSVVPLRSFGPVWVIVLPATALAVMVMPWRQLVLVVLSHLMLTSTNLTDVRADQLILAITNILSSFTFTAGASYVVRRERASRAELAQANEKLREYAAKVQTLAAAEERSRLAQEIHDGAAHHLTAANMLVAAGVAVLPENASAEAIDALKKAQGQIREAIGELRAAIAQRFEPAEPRQPLVQRILRLIEQSNLPAELKVVGDVEGAELRLEAEHALYRVAQEALTNAGKHAPGARILLTLDVSAPSRARLSAENDEPGVARGGDGAVGLLSLRERIQKLGGTFRAGADRERGRFVVIAEVNR